MTARASRWVLWLLFALVVPLPFFLVETGAVPAARLLLLAGAHLAVIAAEGARGAVGIAAALLLGQAAVYLVCLWGIADLCARRLARRGRRRAAVVVALTVLGSLVLTSSFDFYHTPFRTRSLQGSLLEIFQ